MPRRREMQLFPFANKKIDTQVFFESANSGGDVGLHAVQPLGRACDAARLDDGAKDVKIG